MERGWVGWSPFRTRMCRKWSTSHIPTGTGRGFLSLSLYWDYNLNSLSFKFIITNYIISQVTFSPYRTYLYIPITVSLPLVFFPGLPLRPLLFVSLSDYWNNKSHRLHWHDSFIPWTSVQSSLTGLTSCFLFFTFGSVLFLFESRLIGSRHPVIVWLSLH